MASNQILAEEINQRVLGISGFVFVFESKLAS